MGDCDTSRPKGELRSELVETVNLRGDGKGGSVESRGEGEGEGEGLLPPLFIKTMSSCEVKADGACRYGIDNARCKRLACLVLELWRLRRGRRD